MIRLNEFLTDSQQVGLNVVVGQGDWEQQLENNKLGLHAAVCRRAAIPELLPAQHVAGRVRR